MATLGFDFLDKNKLVTPAPGPTVERLNAQRGSIALAYIGSNIPYVVVFILLVLVMYWTIGNKGTFYFLLLVLGGQLIFNVDEIKLILPKG